MDCGFVLCLTVEFAGCEESWIWGLGGHCDGEGEGEDW